MKTASATLSTSRFLFGQVKDDVDLVWENCLKYNSRDSDEVTREICNEIKQEFEKRWGEAGLGPQIKESHKRPALMKGRALQDDSLLAEKDVPSEFDLIRGTNSALTFGQTQIIGPLRSDKTCKYFTFLRSVL